ncbi:MAG TPA: porphobilinogen synthase [Saprospiraceae bacterium]|nr:porphobilinogen synthase [Saprospiraceae bacterium]HNT18927.1 porphobilinogen synthase [Saprospiraceae bacterium]
MEEKLYSIHHRRLRLGKRIRELVNPFRISHRNFIYPLFVDESLTARREIEHMNGICSETRETVFEAISSTLASGINKFLLFPIPAKKRKDHFDFSFAADLVAELKQSFGDGIWLATDICLCSYTDHGHCGILNEKGDQVLNHESVKVLGEYAYLLAKAGADCVAPSDMMDGRVGHIRQQLNAFALEQVTIMSYSAKFSSQWYGPFRDACHSAPDQSLGIKDRKSYQLSPLSSRDAVQCALRDEAEGADILMVKPAALYTDVIWSVKQKTNLPIAAYHVSGEYASVELMAAQGVVDRAKAHLEVWAALQRSGADIIISYAAPFAKSWIENYDF